MGFANAALPFDSFLGGSEWKDAPILLEVSSSGGMRGDDMMLDVRFGNMDRGGARPRSSRETCLGFSGELAADLFSWDEGIVDDGS
jgi:hypothetical protein